MTPLLSAPEVVIDRLPVYARTLAALESRGRHVVSSQELGNELGVTPAQIRKDLSYFGRFGKQGRGYNVQRLAGELRRILGLDQEWRMVLVGVGNLGRAILRYRGFTPEGFKIIAAFDTDLNVVGRVVGGVRVYNVEDLPQFLKDNPADIGIVAVRAVAAQEVADILLNCGIKGILNYAPVALRVPKGKQLKDIEPVLALQSMTYYLKSFSP
ncbi:MAG TPA: redox-sensing transcriptional repressor Rex [Dehalococcoidia bacterium]|nr:redox-sensing transcriptional repressor Rex [Dehalococcoidia bacterium]